MSAADIIGMYAGAIGMVTLGLAVLTALRLLPSGRASAEGDLIWTLLAVFGWCLTLIGALGFCVLLMHLWGLLLWFGLIVVLLMALNRSRREKRRAMLQLMALAAQRQVPLPSAMLAAADDARGPLGDEARHFAAAVARGMPLGIAMNTFRLLPRRAQPVVHLGIEAGQLPAALQEATRERETAQMAGQWVVQLLYLVGVINVALTVLTFVMIKIVPAFKTIFEDFDTELPAITQLLIDISTLVVEFSFLFIPLWLVLIGLFFYSLLLYLGWIEADLPWVDRLLSGFESADVLRALAVAVEAGHPVARSTQSLGHAHPKPWMRRRLLDAAGEMLMGHDWIACLWRTRLIGDADAGLLQASERAGNLAWALRTTADTRERRLAYRLRMLLEFLSPLVLLLIALGVGFIVISLFIPLIKIVETLT